MVCRPRGAARRRARTSGAAKDRPDHRRAVAHREGDGNALRGTRLERRGDDALAGSRNGTRQTRERHDGAPGRPRPGKHPYRVAAGVARFGRIDALVNNAGYGQYGIFEAIPREKILQQFDVNVFGVMDVIRAILPHFRANQAGSIVNVSSGAGLFTLPMISLYSASKFALEGFSEALAYELASQHIAVKIVEPHGGV